MQFNIPDKKNATACIFYFVVRYPKEYSSLGILDLPHLGSSRGPKGVWR